MHIAHLRMPIKVRVINCEASSNYLTILIILYWTFVIAKIIKKNTPMYNTYTQKECNLITYYHGLASSACYRRITL